MKLQNYGEEIPIGIKNNWQASTARQKGRCCMKSTIKKFTKGSKIPMNLQLFADPSPKPNPQPSKQDNDINLDDVLTKFEVNDILNHPSLQKALQSRIDTTVTKALNTARTKWEAEAADNLDEATKLAKMTEEQREKYQFNKDKEQFALEKKNFEHEQLKNAAGSELLKRGLDASFAEYLTADTAENTTARIDTFEKVFNNALGDAFNKKMKGNPPKDVNKPSTLTKEQIKQMSPTEINANWDAVKEALKKGI